MQQSYADIRDVIENFTNQVAIKKQIAFMLDCKVSQLKNVVLGIKKGEILSGCYGYFLWDQRTVEELTPAERRILLSHICQIINTHDILKANQSMVRGWLKKIKNYEMKNGLILSLEWAEKEWEKQDDHVKELRKFRNNLIVNLDSELD